MTSAHLPNSLGHTVLAFASITEALRVYLQAGKTRTEPWTGEELHRFLVSAIKNTTCDVDADIELEGKQAALFVLNGLFATAFDEPVTINCHRGVSS